MAGEHGDDGGDGSGDPWANEGGREREQKTGSTEAQQWRREMDGGARKLPGKVAAGEEKDRDGDCDPGRTASIPCTRLQRTARRSFLWSWIWKGMRESLARRDGSSAGVRFRGKK